MRKFLLLLALLSVGSVFSQSKSFKVSGTLIGADDQAPLEAATVYVQRVKDSSLVSYTISDRDGSFVLEDKTYDDKLHLLISYVGYNTHSQIIKIPQDKTELKLDVLPLELSSNSLSEVVIQSTAPVTIKKDTLEFNVSSFKTKKDANVEDLLKQLPGVEIDDDGKIKINGKDVNKILVNGKPFFGDDPSITTKNLTKDIIEKIQIVDTKTKSEAFTGEKGDKDNKTINLTIKEENNKGVFGRVSAGAGTDKRYELAGMVNVFDNDQRISVLAGGNNTNSPGFSFGEISKMFGRSGSTSWNSNGSFSIGGRSFGGGEGITKSQNVGANYADKIGEFADVSGDYFYSGSNSENESSSQRETILSDSRFFSNSVSRSVNDTDSHTANLDFEIKVDSTFLINIKPSFGYTTTQTNYYSSDNTLNENQELINQSMLNSNVESLGKRFSNNLSLTKKYGSDGAFFRLQLNNSINNNESDDYLSSDTEVFGSNPESINRNQYTSGLNKSRGLGVDFTYRLPVISKKLFLNFEYEYDRDSDENTKSTFDHNSISNGFDDFNEELSTDFDYLDTKHSPGLKVSYETEKWFTSLKGSYVFRTLENNDLLREHFNVKKDFEAFEIDYYFNYRFSKKASVYSGYDYKTAPPALRQLQAYSDVSNPLNIVIGNPNLSPSNKHSFYLGYSSFDWQKRTGFYIYTNFDFNNNEVVSKTEVDPETLKRITTYANVDGNYRGNASVSYSKNFKLDSLRQVKVRLSAWGNLSKNINFNNGVQYASKVASITPNLSLEFDWKKVMEFKPYYRITFSKNKYDIEAFEDRTFSRHNLGLRTATFLPKNFEWRNDISFNYNPDIAEGFQKDAWFWNSTLAYSVLKDQGAVTLKVYDLLNQNTNARRTATRDYIEDSQSTVLTQYFMLSFSWKFNSLGSKGETRSGGMHFF
ncbi:outer membrane beta-barrel protein [Bizionia paragorgiae]|uniref:outer membrane beta-barrel protein n=1 Tax=Bizionia paragorgiae TaxID=283786 RepID=UPI003A8F446C